MVNASWSTVAFPEPVVTAADVSVPSGCTWTVTMTVTLLVMPVFAGSGCVGMGVPASAGADGGSMQPPPREPSQALKAIAASNGATTRFLFTYAEAAALYAAQPPYAEMSL